MSAANDPIWGIYGSMRNSKWAPSMRQLIDDGKRFKAMQKESARNIALMTGTRETVSLVLSSPSIELRPRLSEEDKAEIERRTLNRRRITARAPLIEALSGKVVTYLHENGRPIVDENGDLRMGDIVPRKVHLERLRTAYLTLWRIKVTTLRHQKLVLTGELDEIRALREASERLELALSDRFIAPVNFTIGRHVARGPAGTRAPTVGIQDFDRRLRLFVDRVFSGGSPLSTLNSQSGGKLMDSPARVVIDCFLSGSATRR